MCMYICQETTVIEGKFMRCRSKRHVKKVNNSVDSKCCGANNKCKSLKKKKDDLWFVCMEVQNDRKTPESLTRCEETETASSEIDEGDCKIAAV